MKTHEWSPNQTWGWPSGWGWPTSWRILAGQFPRLGNRLERSLGWGMHDLGGPEPCIPLDKEGRCLWALPREEATNGSGRMHWPAEAPHGERRKTESTESQVQGLWLREDRGPRGRAARPRGGLTDKAISELQSVSALNGPWVTGSCWRQRPKLLMIGDERLRLLDTGTLSVPLGNAGRCAFFLSLLPIHAHARWRQMGWRPPLPSVCAVRHLSSAGPTFQDAFFQFSSPTRDHTCAPCSGSSES